MPPRKNQLTTALQPKSGPFRRAVLRGLAILLPPLLTIVIFLWVGNTVAVYLLEPMEGLVRYVMVEHVADIRTPTNVTADGAVVLDGAEYPIASSNTISVGDDRYRQTNDGKLVPESVYGWVERYLGKDPMPATAKGVYTWYVDRKWLPREFVVPVFLCLFVLVLYLLGKFLAAGVGRFFWKQIERVIDYLPLVRNVYSSVKQVTDFMITDPDIQYTRVVAIQYPRKGIWMPAFVTGEGLFDVRDSVGEPLLSVLVPTSPMPFTGFTVMVKKSEVIDLNISLDQAFQFIVSCGVVSPPEPIADRAGLRLDAANEEALVLAGTVSDDD